MSSEDSDDPTTLAADDSAAALDASPARGSPTAKLAARFARQQLEPTRDAEPSARTLLLAEVLLG